MIRYMWRYPVFMEFQKRLLSCSNPHRTAFLYHGFVHFCLVVHFVVRSRRVLYIFTLSLSSPLICKLFLPVFQTWKRWIFSIGCRRCTFWNKLMVSPYKTFLQLERLSNSPTISIGMIRAMRKFLNWVVLPLVAKQSFLTAEFSKKPALATGFWPECFLSGSSSADEPSRSSLPRPTKSGSLRKQEWECWFVNGGSYLAVHALPFFAGSDDVDHAWIAILCQR